MKRKIIVLIMLVLLTPSLAYGDTDTYRPYDSSGAPENNRDSLYLRDGEIRDFSLSIPVVNTEFDIICAIAFRDVNITQFSTINEANLSLNFQLDFQSSPLSLEVSVYGYDDDLGTGTFTDSLTSSIPVTANTVTIDLQNITSPGFVDFDVTSIIQEITNRETWSSGDTLGLIIYSVERARSRSYMSNYGILRPKLTVRHGEADYIPPTDEEGGLIDQYKGYDIWRTAKGWRVLVFEDASGDDWFINVGNSTGSQTVYNYSLPFNVDLWETLQDVVLVIGSDIWMIGDSATTVTLYKSINGGQSWVNMHDFTVSNSLEAWTMSYNPETGGVIHILGADETNRRIFYMSYNVSADAELDAPYLLHTCQNTGPYDMDITTDEDNTLWVGIIGGGAWGSETRLTVYKRYGTWSSPRVFAGAIPWITVDINYAWNKPENEEPIYFVVGDADHIYGDHISQSADITTLLFDSGDSPYELSEPYTDCNHAKSILVEFPEENDPYDAYYYIKLVYDAPDWTTLHGVPQASITNFPYPSTSYYNEANYTHNFDQHLIYEDLNHSRIWTQCNNEATRLYEFSTEWLEYGAYKKLYWDRRIMLTHHEAINEFSCPSDCFGALGWVVFYPNGTEVPPDKIPCLESATTLEEVQNCIDNALLGGGTSDDPSPGGWADEGPFRRSRMKLYIFWIGWLTFWLPWFYVGHSRGFEKIMSFWVAVLISLVGLALLWALPGI